MRAAASRRIAEQKANGACHRQGIRSEYGHGARSAPPPALLRGGDSGRIAGKALAHPAVLGGDAAGCTPVPGVGPVGASAAPRGSAGRGGRTFLYGSERVRLVVSWEQLRDTGSGARERRAIRSDVQESPGCWRRGGRVRRGRSPGASAVRRRQASPGAPPGGPRDCHRSDDSPEGPPEAPAPAEGPLADLCRRGEGAGPERAPSGSRREVPPSGRGTGGRNGLGTGFWGAAGACGRVPADGRVRRPPEAGKCP